MEWKVAGVGKMNLNYRGSCMTDEIIRKLEYVITKLEIQDDRTSKEAAKTLKTVKRNLNTKMRDAKERD